MIKLKVIKSKEFTANGEKHTHYTAAYKGRVFGVSTLRFEDGDLEEDNKVLTIKTEVEVLKNVSADPLTGEIKNYIDIVPKSGLILAEF